MWVKRTQQEIEDAKREVKRNRKFLAVLLGIAICLGSTFLHGKYWRRSGYASVFVSFSEVSHRLPFSATGGVLAAFLFYWCKPMSRKTVICTHCDKAKADDGVAQCSCGKDFVGLETVKWV